MASGALKILWILICASVFDMVTDSVLSPSFAWICFMSSAVYVLGTSCSACRVSPCVVTVQEEVLTPSAPFGWKRFSSHLCTAVIDVAVTLGPLLMLEAFDARPGHHFFCFAVLAGVGAAHWEAGVMEADVLSSADKRYVHKEDEKHFLKVLQHAPMFGHPSLITGQAAVVTAAVAAACRVAFFLPVVPELFYGFDVVSFGIEAVRVPDFCREGCACGLLQGASGLLFWHRCAL